MRSVLAKTALVGLVVLSACSDNPQAPSQPGEPQVYTGEAPLPAPGTCTTPAALTALANKFGGNADAIWLKLSLASLFKLKQAKIPQVQKIVLGIVDFLLKKKDKFPNQALLLQFINNLLCWAGLPPAGEDLGGVAVVTASETQETQATRTDGQAGLVIPPGAFNVPAGTPVLITMTLAPGGLLNTLLDQYPGVFNFQASAALDGTVVIGVCLTVDVPTDIFPRLRLGHDLEEGEFEITPAATPPSGLNCDSTPGAAPSFGLFGKLSSFLASVGRFFLPQTATATVLAGGGVGGSAGKLSPFGPVDPKLSATGGTGGSAGKLAPPALVLGNGGARPRVEVDCEAEAGTNVPEECRPQVTIMTAKYAAWLATPEPRGPQQGNLIPNVPVLFEVGTGAGPNPEDPPVVAGGAVGTDAGCPTSGNTVTINTNASGFARACWTLSSTPGFNKVWVTPNTENLPDDLDGVHFDPATITFFANGTADSFQDGFETESGWAATGFWHRTTLTNGESQFVNSAVTDMLVNLAPGDLSAGALPSPFEGSYVFWYGQDASGNYIGTRANSTPGSGGQSTSPNSGTLTSPVIVVPASGVLAFRTWFEIESVDAWGFDLMTVSVEPVSPAGPTVQIGSLNPETDYNGLPATPFSSGGFNTPPSWIISEADLSGYVGQSIRLKFTFNTGDALYNGFRGWIIDQVQVFSQPSALRAFGSRAAVGLNPPKVPGTRNP